MSILVAVTKGDRTVVASDRLTCFGHHAELSDNVTAKAIHRVGLALIGSTGWSLYDNILEDYLSTREPPVLEDRASIFKFFIGFWKIMREDYSFVEDQCNDDDSPFVDLDARFLVVTRNGIFGVESNMDVAQYKKYHAIGCASEYAYGAIHSLYDDEPDPRRIAEAAVQAAVHFDIHCAGEVQVFELEEASS